MLKQKIWFLLSFPMIFLVTACYPAEPQTETTCSNFWVNPNTGEKECLNHTISSNTQGKKIVFVENPNGKQS